MEDLRVQHAPSLDSSMSESHDDHIAMLQGQINSLQDEKVTLEQAREQDQLVIARWEREKQEMDILQQMLKTDINKLNNEK